MRRPVVNDVYCDARNIAIYSMYIAILRAIYSMYIAMLAICSIYFVVRAIYGIYTIPPIRERLPAPAPRFRCAAVL